MAPNWSANPPSGARPRSPNPLQTKGSKPFFSPPRPKFRWTLRRSFWTPAPSSSISAAPSACALPSATSSGTRKTTPRPSCFADAAYGLPEYCRERIRNARLISNPGCYPTAANLAIRPLIEAGIVDRNAGIVCDAKSGVSGAGRKPTLKTSFCEATENFSAYSILKHRHVPEVLLTSGLEEREFSFTAQLLPIDRGILETIYFRLAQPLSGADIVAIYEKQLRQRAVRPAL